MNPQPRFAFLLLLLASLAVNCGDRTKVYTRQDQQPLKFRMMMCGIGPNGSTPVHVNYEVSDGTMFYTEFTEYKTAKLAQDAMEIRKRSVQRTIREETVLDKDRKTISETITAIIMSVDGKERAAVLSLENRILHVIDGASLRHIEDFQKPNREQ